MIGGVRMVVGVVAERLQRSVSSGSVCSSVGVWCGANLFAPDLSPHKPISAI